MNGWFESDGLKLARYLALPAGRALWPGGGRRPGLIMCHGFPVGPIDARHSAGTFPELMDRVANEMGWLAMTFTFRGCGESEGNFSLKGWIDDLGNPRLTSDVQRLIVRGVAEEAGGRSVAELARWRDEKLVEILRISGLS